MKKDSKKEVEVQRAAQAVHEQMQEQKELKNRKTVTLSVRADTFNDLRDKVGSRQMSATIDALIIALLKEMKKDN